MLSEDVRHSRASAMQEFMAQHGIDALIFLTPDWVFFATNYPEGYLEPWERPLAVCIPREGAPFALMHEISSGAIDESSQRGEMWVSDVTVYAERPQAADRMPIAPEWAQTMSDLLSSRGLGAGRIGVDTISRPIAAVQALLPALELIDLGVELRELRLVKHADELRVVRAAASLSDWGQERYREGIRAGRLLTEFDYSICAAIAEEAARRHPGATLALDVMSLAGAGSASPHGAGTRTDARIERGDVIVNFLCVRLDGIWVENERTWLFGEPDDLKRRAFDAARDATTAAQAACRTGNPVKAIEEASYQVFARAGFDDYILHRTGHGMGIANHEFPHDLAFNTRALRTGEVYAVEPGIYLPGVGGFRQDDTVIVGPEPEVVTSTPKDLEFLMVE